MIVFRKARSSRRTLNDLDAYIRQVGNEPVEWLAREVQKWGEFSYSELETAILDGHLNDLIDWQARYADVVNNNLAPMWAAAMAAAAKKATKGQVVLDDSDVFVKAWIKAHGGELITQLSEASQQAVAAIILRGQSERILPRDMAKQIRPLIGLTEVQAQANANYREKVYRTYIENGMTNFTAAAKADKAALRYAGKQHRERAETIVHTELAFAYNRGAHIGVQQAISDRLMGRCEMVWTTAGTNRVCSRCLALKDTVVGHTDESGVTLLPLHPRCRCAIMYNEVKDKPLTAPTSNGNVGGEIKLLSPEQIKTIRDDEEKAFQAKTGADFGFKKMTSPPDWAKEISFANGDGKGIERRMNCQRCVVAHEARMRGYDVIARPCWGAEDPMQSVGALLSVFEDSGKETFRCVGSTVDEIKKFIVDKMTEWGKGSRAFVWFNWDNLHPNKGHVIVTQFNENNFVNFGDPQMKKIGATNYLKDVNFDSVIIIRVDKLKFTELVKRCCMNKE